jgi:site-specific DNA-methyltransferase (adenine-specific)
MRYETQPQSETNWPVSAGTGDRLRSARLAQGLSLADLAKRLGVTKGYLSRVEAGKTRPSVEWIEHAARALNIEAEPLQVALGHVPAEVTLLLKQHPVEAPALLRQAFGEYLVSPPAVESKGGLAEQSSRQPALPGAYELVLGNCFQWMQQRAPASIHAIVTDPPYGLKEYTREETAKLRDGHGGVWRIPPAFDGAERMPLPRFTVLTAEDKKALQEFFAEWAALAYQTLVPGGHLFIATNPLVSHLLYIVLEQAGFEKRGEIIRLVQTLRGGDRPKNAHEEFRDVTVMPRSAWEPWGLFRKPCEGRVQDNLRKWKAGGLRRVSDEQPFTDVIKSAPTRPDERDIAPHPSLKPQAFMRQIVRAALPLAEGIILDPFMGGGSTIAAACALGYQSIGIEADEVFYKAAVKAIPDLARLSTNGIGEARQERLFI